MHQLKEVSLIREETIISGGLTWATLWESFREESSPPGPLALPGCRNSSRKPKFTMRISCTQIRWSLSFPLNRSSEGSRNIARMPLTLLSRLSIWSGNSESQTPTLRGKDINNTHSRKSLICLIYSIILSIKHFKLSMYSPLLFQPLPTHLSNISNMSIIFHHTFNFSIHLLPSPSLTCIPPWYHLFVAQLLPLHSPS